MSRTPENTPPAIPEKPSRDKPGPDGAVTDGDGAEPTPPLNRADRRKQAKKGQPGHVGPRNDPLRTERGPRPHSKRQI